MNYNKINDKKISTYILQSQVYLYQLFSVTKTIVTSNVSIFYFCF